MATISGVQGSWQVDLMVTETSTSIENNTSTAYWELWVRRTDSGSYPIMGTPTINIYVSGILAHSSSEYRNEQKITSAGRLWLSGTVTDIPHHADGTIVNNAISFSWTGSGFSPNNVSAAGFYSTSTIPRASEISSVSTADIGSNATISVNRKSSSFTHTITYSFGSLSGTIVTKSSNTSISWTIPTSFYAQIPNSKTGTGTLTITTYNGNTQIGSSKTKSFSVTTNENSCKPSISATIKDVNEDTLALTGNELYLVKNHSTVEVTYEATAKNSASISQVDVNGRVMSSSPYIFTASDSENNLISITAKDSRDYGATERLYSGTVLKQSLLRATPDPVISETAGDYVFINYVPLSASIIVTRRAPTSDELLISFSGNYFNNTFGAVNNQLTLTWKYREYKSNPTDWGDITAQTLTLGTDYVLKGNTYHSGNNANYEEEISLGHLFDYRKNYEIMFIYSDKLNENFVTKLGIKGTPIVNWGEDYFNVNGDIRQNGKSIFEVNACKMVTNGWQTVQPSQITEITVWDTEYEYGDYECDLLNNQLKITNTTMCQISGAFAGNGYAWARLYIYEESTGNEHEAYGALIQPSGNEYFWQPLQTVDVLLDPTKTYCVKMKISGYNKQFDLNAGFADNVTWISARKIF